jgi:hypothetical protein
VEFNRGKPNRGFRVFKTPTDVFETRQDPDKEQGINELLLFQKKQTIR